MTLADQSTSNLVYGMMVLIELIEYREDETLLLTGSSKHDCDF